MQGIFYPGLRGLGDGWGGGRTCCMNTAAVLAQRASRPAKEQLSFLQRRGPKGPPWLHIPPHPPGRAAGCRMSGRKARATGPCVRPAHYRQTWAAARQPVGGKENSSSSSQRVPSAPKELGLTLLPNLLVSKLLRSLPAHQTSMAYVRLENVSR